MKRFCTLSKMWHLPLEIGSHPKQQLRSLALEHSLWLACSVPPERTSNRNPTSSHTDFSKDALTQISLVGPRLLQGGVETPETITGRYNGGGGEVTTGTLKHHAAVLFFLIHMQQLKIGDCVFHHKVISLATGHTFCVDAPYNFLVTLVTSFLKIATKYFWPTNLKNGNLFCFFIKLHCPKMETPPKRRI